MRPHNFAEGLVEGHAVLAGLSTHLSEKCKLDSESVDFLVRHSFFAYPRTLWMKFAVDINDPQAELDVRLRHRLNPQRIGSALQNFVATRPAINKIVFDLTDVTIFGADHMRDVLGETSAEIEGKNYVVCSAEVGMKLKEMGVADESTICETEAVLFQQLRDVPENRKCRVKLSKEVDFGDFEEALVAQASEEKLRGCDAIVFDLTEVSTLSFGAHCMFSPVIHSLAHSHGILAEVSAARNSLRSKVVQEFVEHGSLWAMRSNLIHTPQKILHRQDFFGTKSCIFPLHTFLKDELGQIQRSCYKALFEILSEQYRWTLNVIEARGWQAWELGQLTASRPEDRAAQLRKQRYETVIWELWDIIQELVDNVAGHALGLGYVMIELDPLPGRGLNIYVGDTGIGLARGLEGSYQMKGVTHVAAAEMAMSLAGKLDQRRQLPGHLKQGGRGLEHVKDLLSKYAATIRIRTGDAEAHFSVKRKISIRTKAKLFDLQGTHICVNFPTHWKSV